MGEEEGTGTGRISDKLDKLIAIMEVEGKEKNKKIRLPKLSKRKMKKNYVLAIILRTNKQIDIKKLKVEDCTIFLKDNKTYHLALTDFVMRYKKYPVIILPEWDLQPLSIDELQGKAITEERMAFPQKILIDRMAKAGLEKKKGMKGIMIIIGIIAGAAIIYFIINSMTKKKV